MNAPWADMVKADAELYVRERDLPRHIAVWPRELRDYSIPGHETIIAHIQKVLRATYAAALRGHWSYDVNRHVALLSALRAEQAGLRRLKAERAAACREDAA